MMRPAPTIRSIAPLALVPWLVLVGGCVFRDAGEPRFYRPESSMIGPLGTIPFGFTARWLR